jgi:hypothetical protein
MRNMMKTPPPSAPPSSGSYNTLPNTPVPAYAYDEGAMEWLQRTSSLSAYGKSTGDLEQPIVVVQQNEHEHQTEVQRLRKKIATYATIFFVLNLIIVIVGGVVDREWGVYAYSNALTLLLFGVGMVNFFVKTRENSLLFGQCYYMFLLLLVLIGVPMGIWYCFTIDERVALYCSMRLEGPCAPWLSNELITLGLVACILGIIAWFVVFTVFARIVFIYLLAIERMYGAENADRINLFVLKTIRMIPDYHSMNRSIWYELTHWGESCVGYSRHLCYGCEDAFTNCCFSCTNIFCSEKAIVWTCCFSFLFFYLGSLVLCESTYDAFWCILAEMFEAFLFIFLVIADDDY